VTRIHRATFALPSIVRFSASPEERALGKCLSHAPKGTILYSTEKIRRAKEKDV